MSPDRITARERERMALALRRQGLRYAQIGERLGITESAAWKAAQRAFARTAHLVEQEAEESRRLDLERLDVALAAIWPAVEAGRLGAIDRLIMILERRARLLGLDAADRTSGDIGAAMAAVLERLANHGDFGNPAG